MRARVNVLRENMRWIRAHAMTSPLMELLGAVVVVFVVLYARDQIRYNVMTVGTFTAFLYALFRVYEPVKRLGGIYNVTDEEPSPPQDVVTYAAGLMGVEPPPETAFEAAYMSPMALSFWGEVKRVSNRKLRDGGYVFRQPNYRAALDDMWSRGRWRG